MTKKLEKAFDNYLKNYDMNVKPIRYKYHHSYRVKELMKKLALMLNLSKDEIEIAEVIGLLHDVGRFEQIKKYGVCSDIRSGIDHADESCIYLFDNNHIKDFYDKEENYEIIKDAIKNHNKYIIDNNLKDKSLFFTKMIRDMDKLDIYKVLTDEYEFEYNINEVSEKVIEEYSKKKSMDVHLRNTKSDSIYTYFAFIYDINYKESFILLKEGKYLENFCNSVKTTEDSKEVFEKLKNDALDYINSKIEANN